MAITDLVSGMDGVAFREFMGNAPPEIASRYPLMADCMTPERYPHQDSIVRYLRDADLLLAVSSYAKDIFTGDATNVRRGLMGDGTFFWSQSLSYYVDRYNVRLPGDFEKHILKSLALET